jgi:hypothetical protein
MSFVKYNNNTEPEIETIQTANADDDGMTTKDEHLANRAKRAEREEGEIDD